MRNAMAKEIKSERARGNGRDLAFTLMPLYALGVGVFAAYKFLKVRYMKIITIEIERKLFFSPGLSPCVWLSDDVRSIL